MKLKITVEDKTYEVEVEASESEAPAAASPYRGYPVEPASVRLPAAAPVAPAPSANGGGAPVNEDKVCRSPIAGIVVKVAAQPGQSIQPGDILIVLEAMKMETNITAPVAGKIAKVNVNGGDSVQAGQVVVEFE
ncbi:MAG: biotin/lipoyl-containing protein [Bryobacteraceae bacterium]|nr:biotin/lipoyl-containing protein [Bryobacteraceae bacterium]